MDNREITQAACALIQWFNSQEISQADAEKVMIKVTAKILTKHFHGNPAEVKNILDNHSKMQAHELIEAIYRAKAKR